MARDGDTAGLDLARGQVAAFHSLQSIIAESHGIAALGATAHAAFCILRCFTFLGANMVYQPLSTVLSYERMSPL